MLLTQASHLDRSMSLVEESCRVVDTATLLTESSGSTSNPPANRCSPDGTAYIIFTSGSTGRPKGVLVAHRGVRDLMPWLTELHGLGECLGVLFNVSVGQGWCWHGFITFIEHFLQDLRTWLCSATRSVSMRTSFS